MTRPSDFEPTVLPVDPEASTAGGRSAGSHALVELGIPALIALVLTGAWVGGLMVLPEGTRFRTLFDGVIQHSCVFLLVWHLLIVVVRWWKVVRPEQAALDQGFLAAGNAELDVRGLAKAAQAAQAYESRHGVRMVTRRIILAATNLTVRGDEEALGQLMHRRAEADRQRAEDAYAIPNFIFWAIPILGFIGTVVGIGMAIAGLDGADVASLSTLREKIGGIAGALGLAFDTTQVALIFAIIALLVQTLVNRAEMRLHDDIEDHLIYRLESRMRRAGSSGGAESGLVAALQAMTAALAEDGRRRDEAQRQHIAALASGHDRIAEAIHQVPAVAARVERTHQEALAQMQLRMDALVQDLRGTLGSVPALLQAGLSQVAEDGAKRFAAAGQEAGKALALERERSLEALTTAQQAAHARAVQAFDAAVKPMLESLSALAFKTEGILAQTADLRRLEQSLADGLAKARTTGRLDEALDGISRTLAAMAPVLEKLGHPIPVRLSLVGIEASSGLVVTPGGNRG